MHWGKNTLHAIVSSALVLCVLNLNETIPILRIEAFR